MIRRYRVRPSPLASILGLVAFAIFACVALSDGPRQQLLHAPAAFIAFFVFVLLAGIVTSVANLAGWRGSSHLVVDTEDENDGGKPDRADVESRLRRLESLKAKGLITEAEYEQRRREILQDI